MEDKVEINSKGTTGHIYINGNEIHHVKGYKLEHNATEIPILTIELNALDYDISIDDVEIKAVTSEKITSKN